MCPHCYNKFGEGAWQFLSTQLLSTLYTLRYEVFNLPITVNNWHVNGKFDERGLRCNICDLVKNKKTVYLSAHILGNAIDFNVKDKTTEDVYKAIRDNIDKFEYPIRMEITGGNWVHCDTYQPVGSEKKLIEFST